MASSKGGDSDCARQCGADRTILLSSSTASSTFISSCTGVTAVATGEDGHATRPFSLTGQLALAEFSFVFASSPSTRTTLSAPPSITVPSRILKQALAASVLTCAIASRAPARRFMMKSRFGAASTVSGVATDDDEEKVGEDRAAVRWSRSVLCVAERGRLRIYFRA